MLRSRGWFGVDQVREMAVAIERSGCQFIWSLRRASTEKLNGFPDEYTDYNEVLPDGFLGDPGHSRDDITEQRLTRYSPPPVQCSTRYFITQTRFRDVFNALWFIFVRVFVGWGETVGCGERTAEKGKVVGWVPQAEVLADVAIGGFVSHCGWNSLLESIWYGVPVATWPIYAEQQLDAFQMDQQLVLAETIEKGIREVMDRNSLVRAKVKEMSAKSRMAMEEGGSSLQSLRRLVDDIM
ncbi:putative UDP-glucuronosyl/UDP-glucosyltransferase, UDP-glycosyltransferase family [Helianthus debilis subsp. tardiflorus]